MHNISRIIGISYAITVITLASISAFARNNQESAESSTGSTGQVHFYEPVRVGTIVLKPGMYQVQHVLQGSGGVVNVNDHAVIFRRMDMPAGYRHGNTPVEKGITARAACSLQVSAKKVRNTQVTLRTNAVGEKELTELQIAGETFKHVF